MEEYLKQEEEERNKYQQYITRRRREVHTKQAEILNQVNQDYKEKHSINKNLQNFNLSDKEYDKNFMDQILSRLPKQTPPNKLNDIGQILGHLSEKREELASK